MRILRFIGKIIAAPFVVVLTIAYPVTLFLFAYIKAFVELVSGLGVLVAIALFIMKNTTGGIIFLVIAFLLSPVGLPAVGEWLIDKMRNAKYSLQDFMIS